MSHPTIEIDRWVSAQLRAHLVHSTPAQDEPYWSYDLSEIFGLLAEEGVSRAFLQGAHGTFAVTFEQAELPEAPSGDTIHG